MKETLNWQDIRAVGKTDNAGRWYPNEDIAEYFNPIRVPSRAYPYSYAKAAQTNKFANWLFANHIELAHKFFKQGE